MKPPAPLHRLTLLATDPLRRDALVARCRSAAPDLHVEPARDMADLMIRVAAGATGVVVVDGRASARLPQEGATLLKGLHAGLQVVIVDADPGMPVPHQVDHLLDSAQFGSWLARRYPGGAA